METAQGWEKLEEIKTNLDLLGAKKSRKKAEEVFREIMHQVFAPFQHKYGNKINTYGIGEQTSGGRETGRLSAHVEWLSELTVDLDFLPSKEGGELVYARHIVGSPKELMEKSPLLTIVHECAKKLKFSSGIHQDYAFSVKPTGISIGGNYSEGNLPGVTKLIFTVDDLIDLYCLP